MSDAEKLRERVYDLLEDLAMYGGWTDDEIEQYLSALERDTEIGRDQTRDEELKGLAARFQKAQSQELMHSIKDMQSSMNTASDRMIDQMIAEWEASGTEFAKQRIEDLKRLKSRT